MTQKKITGSQVEIALNDLTDVTALPIQGDVLTFDAGLPTSTTHQPLFSQLQ